ncbi:MAG: hypothetical protein ACFE9I_01130 [Candidatus Hermodarchaeota archaeon]
MSTFLKEFKFEKVPLKITYLDEEPLILNNKFVFFHNKSKLRKDLTKLQYLIKSYTNNPLQAAGIRDSYLKEEFSETFLIVLLTLPETIQNTNNIIETYSNIEINSGCFYIATNQNFMLLLTKDMKGFTAGINTMETILKQVMEDYMSQKKFDDYIKICSFNLINCI